MPIPASAQSAIHQIVKFSPAEFDAFLDALAQAAPTIKHDKFWSHVAPHVAQVEEPVVKAVIKELFPMYMAKERMGVTVAEFADVISEGASKVKSKHFSFDSDAQAILKERIIKIFGGRKGFDVTTKSIDVLLDHSRVFGSAKILTDIRPVFNAEGDSVDAAVIVHNLKISYSSDAGSQEFYTALDTSDIQALREVLDRAETKAKCLEDLLQKTGVSYLDAKE